MSTATLQRLPVRSVQGLARVPGAAEALAKLLAQRQGQVFAWGVHDCCLWAADAIAAQLGVDPAADLRGRYATARQARLVVAMLGGSLRAIATAALGQPLPHPMHACAGDVGLVTFSQPGAPADAALGVCLGEWWALPAAGGMTYRPMTESLASWRVG